MRIRLAPERRSALLDGVQSLYRSEFDEELSRFHAEQLVDFFIAALGPPVYNQAVHDAVGYMEDKLADIEGEVYERETPV